MRPIADLRRGMTMIQYQGELVFVTCGHVSVAFNRSYKTDEDTEKLKFGRVEGKDALDDGGQDDGQGMGFRLHFSTARLISHLWSSSRLVTVSLDT